MIIPLPVIGLALASRIPFQKKGENTFKPRKTTVVKKYTRPMPQRKVNPPPFPQVLKNAVNGLSSTLSMFRQKKTSYDFDEIIKGFIPSGAMQLAPQYPSGTRKYILADLDGDTKKELVAAYRLNDINTTFVLKRENDKWRKLAETSDSQFKDINFLGAADVTGENKEHLLIGWRTNDGYGKLHGYALNNEKLEEVFAHNYNYLEVLPAAQTNDRTKKVQLALWNRKESDGYDISVKQWNGNELEPDKNQLAYYQSRVLPYYGRMVKKMPGNPTNWLNLAEALEKAGLYRDALKSAEIGLSQASSSLREEFLILKDRLLKKL